jgi:hypothetical protein
LISTGLYLDLPAWGRHVFVVSTIPKPGQLARHWRAPDVGVVA